MSKTSVSEFRNRLNLTRMFCDFQNNGLSDLPSEGNKSVDAEVVKSSNCVINIDYVVQEEKISFEVFRSSMDSNCVFKKKFSLRRSKSCTQLNSTEQSLYKVSKLVQTNDIETSQILSRSNLGPPLFKKNHFERPVKDTTSTLNSYDMYKENYGVSNFKFPENPVVVQEQTSNFCSLEFDGTRSTRKNYYHAKNKHNYVKRVKSNIDIKKTRFETPLAKPDFDAQDYNLNNFPGFEHELQKEVSRKSRYRSREKKSGKQVLLENNEHVAFQFALTPKNESSFYEQVTELEKVESPKHKHRRIIVTSNTLQPTVKPNMKNFQQQTNLTEIFESADNTSSVNELYITPNFKTSRLTSAYSVDKRKKRKRKMTMTIFPCLEIKSTQYEEEVPLYQKRPTMPRRKIGSSKATLGTLEENAHLIKNEIDSIERMKKHMPRRTNELVEQPDHSDDDCENICDKLTKILKEEKKSTQYNKKIDELCILINSLLKDKVRSRSQSPAVKKSTTYVTPKQQEEKKKPIPKLEKLKITHNRKDNVNISSTLDDESPNLVPRNVLQVSPRANEIFKNREIRRKNVSVSNQLSIMPDPKHLEQLKTVDSTKKTALKRSVDSKGNCSSVTFSSQVAILGKTNETINEDNLKNTLFPVNRVLFKRSKTLPTKPDFNASSSINSTIASSFVGDLSSFSNSDICSVTEEKSKIPKSKSNVVDKPKSPKPGALENSTFLRAKRESTSNSFQKRKDYYKNLKFKMKNKLYAPDFGRISESSIDTQVPSTENIEEQQIDKEPKSNTTVIVHKNENKNVISTKELVSKNDQKSTIVPFQFPDTNTSESGKKASYAYPSDKNSSPHKVVDVKKRITNFLQSYPLEITTPILENTSPAASIKEQPVVRRVKSKLPKRI